VYSRHSFSVRRGLGIETRISVPLSLLQWQYVALELTASLNSDAVTKWDHVTGSLPIVVGTQFVCGLDFLSGEGEAAKLALSIVTIVPVTNTPAPASLGNGSWHTVRIQIFPDGRCGSALDGKPIAIVDAGLQVDQPYRLDVSGKSVGTRVLVGPIEVWEGVRGGVNWLEAPTHR